jgi:DNA polymerase-3 subunit gamma/tau
MSEPPERRAEESSAPADAPSPPVRETRGAAGGESDDTALGPRREAPTTAAEQPRQRLTVTDVRRLWPEVLEEVKGRRRFAWILLSQNAHVTDVRDGVLVLALAGIGPRDSFAKGGNENILREALNEVLGADFRIEAIVDPSVPAGGGRSGGPGYGDDTDRAPASWPSDARPGSPAATSSDVLSGPAPGTQSGEGPGPVSWSGGATSDPGELEDSAADSVAGTASSAAPAVTDTKPSVDARWRDEARQHIRPTRQGGPVSTGSQDDLRDEAASVNDSDIDELAESHTELLARQLGAEIIGEEKHGL